MKIGLKLQAIVFIINNTKDFQMLKILNEVRYE